MTARWTRAIRAGVVDDLPRLLALENAAFEMHRMSRRSFRHMLTRANADLLVAERRGDLLGYALLVYRRGTRSARLYSLAVARAARGQGLGNALLRAVERSAAANGADFVSLEVHPRNPHARRLYRRAGYEVRDELPDYYDDGAKAFRMQRRVTPPRA